MASKIIIVNPNLFIVANTFWTVLTFVNKKTYPFLPICVSLPISEGLRRLREGKSEGEEEEEEEEAKPGTRLHSTPRKAHQATNAHHAMV